MNLRDSWCNALDLKAQARCNLTARSITASGLLKALLYALQLSRGTALRPNTRRSLLIIMHLHSVLAAVFACITLVTPTPVSRHVLHEKRESVAPRWTQGRRIAPYSRLPMRIGLTQQNLEDAHQHLIDVYVCLYRRGLLEVLIDRLIDRYHQDHILSRQSMASTGRKTKLLRTSSLAMRQ